MLKDTLYYPLSPINVVSIMKLVQDSIDSMMNIQTFDFYSIFTWDYGQRDMHFKHRASNLSMINLNQLNLDEHLLQLNKFVHTTVFATKHPYKNNLTPSKATHLFAQLSQTDLL